MSAPTRQRKPLGVRRTLSDLAFVFELRPCANRGENSGRFTNDIARSRRRWRPRPGPHRRDSVADRKRLRHPLDRGLLHGRARRRNLRYEQTRSLYRVGVGARAHAGGALARGQAVRRHPRLDRNPPDLHALSIRQSEAARRRLGESGSDCAHSQRHDRAHRRGQSERPHRDRKSTRLNSSHVEISYAVFCLKKKKKNKKNYLIKKKKNKKQKEIIN